MRTQPVGDEFERGVAIIVQPAHQRRGAGPLNPCRVQPGRNLPEEVLRFGAQEIVDSGRGGGEDLVARVLGIEDAQRVALQPVLRIFRQVGAVRAEVFDQRGAPCLAAGAVAQRVELQRHPVRNAQFVQQLIGHHQQLDVGLRFGRADHFGVDLVELAIAALLRALIAEQRAVGGHLQRGELLPAVGQVGAGDPGGEFGPQGQRFVAAIPEAVHLFRDDVGRLADGAAEHFGLFEDRHFRAAKAVELAHALERFDHVGESLGVGAENVLGAANGLWGVAHGARPYPVCTLSKSRLV